MAIDLEKQYRYFVLNGKGHYTDSHALKTAFVVEAEMLVLTNKTELLPELIRQHKIIDNKQLEEMGVKVS